MDFLPYTYAKVTMPTYVSDAAILNKMLRRYTFGALSSLLGTSEKLTMQSATEIKDFDINHTPLNAKPAIIAYSGDVYGGLEAHTFTNRQLEQAGRDVLILSGLYGVLRGSDIIQPYRLDISASIETKAGKTLYPYWKPKITDFVNQYCIANTYNLILNLASDEYAKAIDWSKINTQVINVSFLDEKNGKRKVISYNAKRARGIMASMVIKDKLLKVSQLTNLTIDGYKYDKIASSDHHLVYVRS
jgi:uncharacterized protein